MNRGAQLTTGTLVAVELQADGFVCERVVAERVQAQSIFFGSDSAGLAFLDDVDTCGIGKLKIAAANGANVRLVHDSVDYQQGVGATVFFTVEGRDELRAAPMSGGGTISLGTPASYPYPTSASNATGTAFADAVYGDGSDGVASGSLVLIGLRGLRSGRRQILVDGAVEQIGNRRWSPRGGWLAFAHGPRDAAPGGPATLTLLAADGGERIDVAASSANYALAFSPDDTWIAYAGLGVAGGAALEAYSLQDRSEVALGALPEGNELFVAFGDDGQSVLAQITTSTSVGSSIFAGTTAVPGSLRYLVDMRGLLGDVASAGGYVAVPADEIQVYPVAGGAPVSIAGGGPRFEPAVSQPHLLSRTWSDGSTPKRGLVIAAADGSAVIALAVADFFSFATWLGSAVVYGTMPDTGRPVTLSALTQAGAVTTLLASEVESYAWAPIAVPTRIFYARTTATAGGPVGAFYVDLPR